MQNKFSLFAILGVILLIGGAFVLNGNTNNQTNRDIVDGGNVVIEDGVQYIDITARGGYTPRKTQAKAGVPTVLRMKTKNSYDCSTSLVIPDLKYSKYLPRTGTEEIDIPIEKTTGILRGMCSMAMYHFEIVFE